MNSSIFNTRHAKCACALVVAVSLLFTGCERKLKGPSFDPAKSAADAMTQYDSDSNGSLSEDEVEACPGMKVAFPRIDSDGDGLITESEIAARVEYYKTAPVRVLSGGIKVTYKGKALDGARVTFDPEKFLGDDFAPCSGDTNGNGEAFLNREVDAEFPGIYLGFYRVRVSKMVDGKETLPKKYNEESMIGHEAAADLLNEFDVPRFDLK